MLFIYNKSDMISIFQKQLQIECIVKGWSSALYVKTPYKVYNAVFGLLVWILKKDIYAM